MDANEFLGAKQHDGNVSAARATIPVLTPRTLVSLESSTPSMPANVKSARSCPFVCRLHRLVLAQIPGVIEIAGLQVSFGRDRFR
jgi:hypothetical protein